MKQLIVEVLVAGGVAGWLVLAGWLGGVLARRVAAEIRARGLKDAERKEGEDEKEHPQLGMVHGASLGLMALLLGFSFSAAMGRYTKRYDIIAREASALSTVWDRADLLSEGARAEVRAATREYLAARIGLFDEVGRGVGAGAEVSAARARLDELGARLWRAASAGVLERPAAMGVVVGAVGEVSDLLAERNAAASRHIPAAILAVLMACAFVSQAMVGYSAAGAGEATRRRLRLPVWAFGALMTASLWATIDLDFPRLGVIRLNDGPLVELKATLDRAGGGEARK